MPFKKVKSGIDSLDCVLDNIRLGDNVVMQVTSLDDFKFMASAFVKQSLSDERNICYIRFSEHEPLLKEEHGLKIYNLDANEGFETFTVKVHEIIEREGREAFYVFDSLSDLQVAWSTDLMMGNFFCVTCPYLFLLDTVALFPVLRGHHDYSTIARIQETTQILLDIHSNKSEIYLHPIKVWNRYSSEMYLPYKLNEKKEFECLTGSVLLSGYYRLLLSEQNIKSEQNIDSYERFFRNAKEAYNNGNISDKVLNKISRSMMTHDRKMAEMIKKEFSPEDFFFIKERVIGTGTIGGKACGMLLARKMVEKYLPESRPFLEPHDSFYIGTDVFYSFIVENNLWGKRISGRKEENYYKSGEELSLEIMKGNFSPLIKAQFARMLDYFGQIPIIVRSSSFLEDGFNNAFAGKYESIFCANGYDPEERLLHFEDAVRKVYASTVSRSALEYRRKRGMANADEQMAVLVQRVSGTKFGDFYMPCAAGVGFSYSIYRWSDELSDDAGLLRLVAGLGTKAVDRTGADYPRLVNLDKPENNGLTTEEEKHRFSQRYIDVINIKTNRHEEISAEKLLENTPEWYRQLICENDTAAERLFRERGLIKSIRFISCLGIVRIKRLMDLFKNILSVLDSRYGTPVDIEYTINLSPDGEFTVNLLQCRPLYVWQKPQSVSIPEMTGRNTLFKAYKSFMGNSSKIEIDVIIYIDAKEYAALPYNQKSTVSALTGKINDYYRESGKNIILITPGRIGTSSPELGVPVSFSDISNFKVICEYEDIKAGFMPELSFGSHMFQDIAETEMFYVALTSSRDNVLNKAYMKNMESLLFKIAPSAGRLSEIVCVYETSSEKPLCLYADFKSKTVACGYFKD